MYRRWTWLETPKQSSFNTADRKGGPTTVGVAPVVANVGVEQKWEPTAKATHWMQRCRCGALKEYTKLNCLCNILCKCTENTHPVESEEQLQNTYYLRGREIHIKDPIKPHVQWQSNLASFISSSSMYPSIVWFTIFSHEAPLPTNNKCVYVYVYTYIIEKHQVLCHIMYYCTTYYCICIYSMHQLYNSMPQYYLQYDPHFHLSRHRIGAHCMHNLQIAAACSTPQGFCHVRHPVIGR